MIDVLAQVLGEHPRVRYALLFGSQATGSARPDSDVDVALGLDEPLGAMELLELISRLEDATGRRVDVVDLARAGPALVFRVFRDGVVITCRDREAFVLRKARAILDYIDYRPVEDRLVAGVLAAARRR